MKTYGSGALSTIKMENLTAENVSSTANSCPNHTVCILEVTLIILVTFLILTSTIGNLSVFLTTPSLRNSHGYLLISLSVADLGVGAVAALSVYPSATLRASADSWPYGDTACLISAYLMQVFLANSGLSLTLLSVERYIAVAHPLKYSRLVTKKSSLMCVAFCWILTVSVFSTVFFVGGGQEHMYAVQLYACFPVLSRQKYLFSCLFFLLVIFPGLVIIRVTSVITSKKLKKNAKRLDSADAHSTSAHGTSPRTLKLFRMVKLMNVAVTICWIPFLILVILDTIFEISVPQVIFFSFFWMMVSNSFKNSIIYIALNKTLHDRLIEICGHLVPSCCRRLNEIEKSLVCFSIPRNSSLDLTTSGDLSTSASQKDTCETSVEFPKALIN